MMWPSWPNLEQLACSSQHLLGWFLQNLVHVGAEHPLSATLSLEWTCLALIFCKLWPSYSPLFLGAGALADDVHALFIYEIVVDWTTSLLSRLISILGFLFIVLLYVPHILLFNLLHIKNQSRYVHVLINIDIISSLPDAEPKQTTK